MCLWVSVVTKQKVTEREITKTEVVNKMEIFITLTKYNTCQQREESNLLPEVTTSSAYPPPPS